MTAERFRFEEMEASRRLVAVSCPKCYALSRHPMEAVVSAQPLQCPRCPFRGMIEWQFIHPPEPAQAELKVKTAHEIGEAEFPQLLLCAWCFERFLPSDAKQDFCCGYCRLQAARGP